jgi:RNA polymerase sigma-70 factor (ECF subfamily)
VDNEELTRLLTEARKGYSKARETLLQRLRERVRQRARDLLGQHLGARVDCSDIAQEVHLRLWRCFDQFRGDSLPEFLAWVEEIVQSVVTDCRRRHGAGKRDAGREVGGSDPFSAVAGQGTTPSQGAMRNEQQARLDEALERLPEKQRLVFRLRFCEGLPFDEVAQRLGLTASNARVLMLRATERLKTELGENHE